jgi:hypothetical protein
MKPTEESNKIMVNNVPTNDCEKSPSTQYWISTYILYFIATFLMYYLTGSYFHGNIQLGDVLMDSFITHNFIYYLAVYRRIKNKS